VEKAYCLGMSISGTPAKDFLKKSPFRIEDSDNKLLEN